MSRKELPGVLLIQGRTTLAVIPAQRLSLRVTPKATSTTRPKQATPLIPLSHFRLLLDVITVLD